MALSTIMIALYAGPEVERPHQSRHVYSRREDPSHSRFLRRPASRKALDRIKNYTLLGKRSSGVHTRYQRNLARGRTRLRLALPYLSGGRREIQVSPRSRPASVQRPV